jgi:hypothetical protein
MTDKRPSTEELIAEMRRDYRLNDMPESASQPRKDIKLLCDRLEEQAKRIAELDDDVRREGSEKTNLLIRIAELEAELDRFTVIVDAPCRPCEGTGIRKRAAFFPSGCSDTSRPTYECETCSACKGTGKVKARRAK